MKIYALYSKHRIFSEFRVEKEISCIQHTVSSFLDNYLSITPFLVFFQSFLNCFNNLKKFWFIFECLQYVPAYIVTEPWMTCELSLILGLLNYIKRQIFLNNSIAYLSLVLLRCTLFQWIFCIEEWKIYCLPQGVCISTMEVYTIKKLIKIIYYERQKFMW